MAGQLKIGLFGGFPKQLGVVMMVVHGPGGTPVGQLGIPKKMLSFRL